MTNTITTAEEALAALEQLAVDGEPVTAAQLAEAREQVTLGGLIRRGIEGRAEQKRQKAAVAAMAKAKTDAAATLSPVAQRAVLDAQAAVVAALVALQGAVNVYNGNQRTVAETFVASDLPFLLTSFPDQVAADFDEKNHILYSAAPANSSAGAPTAVVVDGVAHSIAAPAAYALTAVHAWQHAHVAAPGWIRDLPTTGVPALLTRGV